MTTNQRRSTKGTSRDDQGTPRLLFDLLDGEFAFDVDLAANAENYLVTRWIGPPGTRVPMAWREGNPIAADALSKRALPLWFGGPSFLNPPFSKPLLGRFTIRARETAAQGATIVGIVPAALETAWFRRDVWPGLELWSWTGLGVADEIRVLDQRLRFIGKNAKGEDYKAGATIPNLVVVWRRHEGPTRWVPFHVPRNQAELVAALANLPGVPACLAGMG